jgi:hypothetical protein
MLRKVSFRPTGRHKCHIINSTDAGIESRIYPMLPYSRLLYRLCTAVTSCQNLLAVNCFQPQLEPLPPGCCDSWSLVFYHIRTLQYFSARQKVFFFFFRVSKIRQKPDPSSAKDSRCLTNVLFSWRSIIRINAVDVCCGSLPLCCVQGSVHCRSDSYGAARPDVFSWTVPLAMWHTELQVRVSSQIRNDIFCRMWGSDLGGNDLWFS